MAPTAQSPTSPTQEFPGESPGESPGAASNTAAAAELALRRLPFFRDIPEAALAPFAAQLRWHSHAAGEIVIEAAESGDQVFFVIEGVVRVVIRTASGQEMIFNDLGTGEFFGELAAIDGVPRSANVTALLRTRLLSVSGPGFMGFVLGQPLLSHRLLRMLTARLRAKDERILESVVLTARHRLMSELLRLSRDRGGGERTVSPPPPQHVIGARIGLRREVVSRELAKMARAGLLTVGRRAIVLHRPDALRAEIDARLSDTKVTEED
jgi:CRP-like cAMP-binding protein